MDSIDSEGGLAAAHLQLLEIRQDPQVKGFARRRAGSFDLAEDALQEAYYAIAKMKNPGQIRNLRAYFCQVLVRKVHELRGQLGTYPVDDVASLAGVRPDMLIGQSPAPAVDETVSGRLLARTWLDRFASQRAYLKRHVPGRSPDPVRYRDLIVSVAERVLLSIVAGDVSEADTNRALRTAYPEWFAGEGCAVGNGHQRFSRARADVCLVLRMVVKRTELSS